MSDPIKHKAEIVTGQSVNVERLVEIFGQTANRVVSITMRIDARELATVKIERYLTEDELALLVEEFQKNEPKQVEFIGLYHHPI